MNMKNKILVDCTEDVQSPPWIEKISPFLDSVMEKLDYSGEELSVMFCSDAFIQNLNKQYRNIDGPTDVLSFEDGGTYTDDEGNEWKSMGDIVISLETLPKNAEYFQVSEDDELKRLLVHGLLHLHGMDHGEEHVEKDVEPECEMLKLQKKVMESFSDVHLL